MCIFKFFFIVILFFLITPSILIRIPAKGSKKMVAFVHSLIFAFIVGIVMYFWQPKPIWKLVQEGLTTTPQTESQSSSPVSIQSSSPVSIQSSSPVSMNKISSLSQVSSQSSNLIEQIPSLSPGLSPSSNESLFLA